MTWTIYGLTDPRYGTIRYIGRTRMALRKRLNAHLGDASNRRKRAWILELRELDLRPRIVELARADTWTVAQQMEFNVVAEARRRKWPLCNSHFRHGCGSGAPPESKEEMPPEEFQRRLAELLAQHPQRQSP